MQKYLLPLFLGMLATVAVAQQTNNTPPAPEPAPQSMHPRLELKFTAVDGTLFDLARWHGKVVLIDFWATWCGPCRRAMPFVVNAYRKLHEKGFEIVGISLDRDRDQMLQFTKDKNMPWPQYYDGLVWENKISRRLGIEGIPTMWLVDKQGHLRTTEAGDDLEAEVARLLSE